MCGRFTLIINPEILQLTFSLDSVPSDITPRYNIAPTQSVLALTNDGGRDAEWLRWGLIPSWAKDIAIGNRMINARAETLAEKPSFRNAFKRRRCVIFADGFFEWQKSADGRTKTPMYIRLDDGKPFAFAGLWETWRVPESDDLLRSCTIVTTRPNEFMAPIHNRMPVILDGEALDRWVTPGEMAPEALAPLLRPLADPSAMSAYEVSTLVNNPRNELARCIEPVPTQTDFLL